MNTVTELQQQRQRGKAELAEQKRLDRIAAAEIEQDREDRAAERRRAHRAQAAEQAEAAKTRRAGTWAKSRAALPELAMSALWATMIVLPITLAWEAQAAFAHATLRMASPLNHAFPAAVELGAWLCAFEAHRRTRAGLDAGSYPAWMWRLALIAAVINTVHVTKDIHLAAGLILGGMSLLGVLLHSIRQGLGARSAGSAASSWLTAWRRIRYPRLSIAAASIRAARDLDAATAWRLAWQDRYGVGPDSTKRDRDLGKLIVARELAADKEAAAAGDLLLIDGQVRRGFALGVREFVGQHDRFALNAATAPAWPNPFDALAPGSTSAYDDVSDSHSTALGHSETPNEQRKLGARAAELLPELRAAIARGEVEPNPTVKPIRAWAEARGETCGVPAAQDLRDAVSGMHAVEAA